MAKRWGIAYTRKKLEFYFSQKLTSETGKVLLSRCVGETGNILNMRVMSIYLALLSPSAMVTFQSRRAFHAGDFAQTTKTTKTVTLAGGAIWIMLKTYFGETQTLLVPRM